MAPTMNRQDSRHRAEQAFRLRAVGRSWQEGATALGYRGRQSAQDAVRRHLDRTAPESAEAARRSLVESARITSAVLFDRFAAAVAGEDAQTVAVLNRELARNRDQLAKLLGA